MKYLDLSLPTPEANLACDEALLDWCEAGCSGEILRFWESTSPFVVVGYGNTITREVQVEVCQEGRVPILRRCSGGGAVAQGRGCLNYSLFLEIQRTPALSSIPGTNRHVMDAHRKIFQSLLKSEVKVSGHTDLAINGQKFSGNAQRRRRRWLLYHGTFLLAFDLPLIERLLRMPSQQPTYRANRPHLDFVCNVPIPVAVVKEALQQHWIAQEPLPDVPSNEIARLVEEKYCRSEWNERSRE